MSHILLQSSQVILILALLISLLRFFKGPHFIDRVVIFDLVTIIMMAVASIFSIFHSQVFYVDVALLLGLLSFLGSIAFAYYWEKYGK